MRRPPIPTDRDLAGTHPTGNQFNWLAKRQLGNAIAIAAGRYARGRLVDIGCGEKPYGELLGRHVTEHVGVDHPASPHALSSVDVLATADQVPLPAETFQTALMSEVLEHLEEPGPALREAYRLLAPDGHLIVTTPFMWVLHEEPRDFTRLSPHGLNWHLSQAGFEIVEITPIAGQWSTIALFVSYAIAGLPKPIAGPVASLVQRTGARLDRLHFRPWMAWNHLAVARRPASS